MAQFGVEPKDAFSMARILFASLPLSWQRVMFALGILVTAGGWLGSDPRVLGLGVLCALASFASRALMRALLCIFQFWIAPLLASRYAIDRILAAQLYFDRRDCLTLFLAEENSIESKEHEVRFRLRIIKFSRSALELPINMQSRPMTIERDAQGLEWNPGYRAVPVNELSVNQLKNFWRKAARVYGLPLQEIVGLGIPGGGTGMHGVSIDLLDVDSGAAYHGGVTIWHDVGAPLATLYMAPYRPELAKIATSIAVAFDIRSPKTRLEKECLDWRVAHGRDARAGSLRLRWLPIAELATLSEAKSEVRLGSYTVHSIFKGPLVLSDGARFAVIYVPQSPYDFGNVVSGPDGTALWNRNQREVSFSLRGEVVTFKSRFPASKLDARRMENQS